jgi:transcriptional regulator with XRE-family HTH domain
MLYTTLPICSFTLKAKIPKKSQPIIKPTTLGEHIRRERLKRNHSQGNAAKLLHINQMYLSSWELNQKAPHPKHLKNIIDYLGYVPTITSNREHLGRTYRKRRNLKHNRGIINNSGINMPCRENDLFY